MHTGWLGARIQNVQFLGNSSFSKGSRQNATYKKKEIKGERETMTSKKTSQNPKDYLIFHDTIAI